MAKPRVWPVADAPPGGGIGRRNVRGASSPGWGRDWPSPAWPRPIPLAEHARHPLRMADAQTRARQDDGAPEFLDAYQMTILGSLAERIVPGATGAGCARFVDRLLAVGEREDGRRFLTALGALDAEARRMFGQPWPGLDEAQPVELLSAASTGVAGKADPGPWTPGTPIADHLEPPVKAPPASDAPAPVTLRDQFDLLKGWVVGAYYSSEAGLRELGYTGPAFAESFPGCTHESGHRES